MSYLTQEQLGQRIAELRTERGASQRRLADVLGLDPSALSRIESGERGLAVGELVSGAEFLGVDPDVLLRDEVDVTPLFRNEGGPGQGTQRGGVRVDHRGILHLRGRRSELSSGSDRARARGDHDNPHCATRAGAGPRSACPRSPPDRREDG